MSSSGDPDWWNDSIWSRALTGASLTGGFVAVAWLLLVVLLIVSGPEAYGRHGRPLRLDVAVIVYPIGALVAGTVLGVGLPWARSRFAAAVLGIVAMAPWMTLICLIDGHGPLHWSVERTVTAALMTSLFGPVLGLSAYRKQHRSGPRKRWQQRKQRVTSRVSRDAG